MTAALRAGLLPRGYTAIIEDSLQIRRSDEYSRRPRADITIYDLKPSRYPQPQTASAQYMTGLVLPLVEVLDDNPISEKPYKAIAIYSRGETADSKPVAWIELLSPSNKHAGDDLLTYLHKRDDILESGIVFVEIDYLHETPPTLARIPDYSDLLNPPAHPYRIVVLDPRPEVEGGWASINEFDVDSVIPSVAIPLNNTDVYTFDFEAPYQKQFQEMLYGVEEVNDAVFPLNFDRYSTQDQTRIAQRMLAVLEAAREGVDLETGPFPVKPVSSLEEALEQINTLVGQ